MKAMSVFGPSRQAAFFGPSVANGALRTWLDLQLAPPCRDWTRSGVRQESWQRIGGASLPRGKA